jgi:ubiquinone/menaquinone biosynthesis C-methylase UbiE
MSDKSFENYTQVAKKEAASNLEVAGRYAFQALAEKRILADVTKKLGLTGGDKLLEIGCGPGNLLVPLSYWVGQASGIDNKIALDRLRSRGVDASRIHLIEGNFLEVAIEGLSFNKILIYSVIQYVDSIETAINFITRAMSLLEPGGRLLLGDLPNTDKKARWAQSEMGKVAGQQWHRQMATVNDHPLADLPADNSLVSINDSFAFQIMAHGRNLGAETYLLSQSSDLPFGNTREDILFIKHV